jgi:hypothetical protein
LGITSSFLASAYNNRSSLPWSKLDTQEAKANLLQATNTIGGIKGQKGAWITEIESIIKDNFSMIDSNSPFDSSKFKVARHDSFVGFTDKGFRVKHK